MTDQLPAKTGSRPLAIIPRSIAEAREAADAIHKAGFAPKHYQSPEQILVGIMHGLEVGLTPMAALQSIAVISGQATIWGDGMLGLVRGSGCCEYIKEWIEEGTNTAYCETKRRGEPEPVTRSFSVEDATAAGLINKPGPWKQYRQRMLQMRARAWCLRDVYADVLRGLQMREEVQDYQGFDNAKDISPEPPKRADYQYPTPRPPASDEHVDDDLDKIENDYVDKNDILVKAQVAATHGVDAIREIWKVSDRQAREILQPHMNKLREAAEKADVNISDRENPTDELSELWTKDADQSQAHMNEITKEEVSVKPPSESYVERALKEITLIDNKNALSAWIGAQNQAGHMKALSKEQSATIMTALQGRQGNVK